MRFSEFASRFLLVRKCASCGELLPYESKDEAFCGECRIKWDVEKTRECGVCGRSVCECVCMTKALSDAGAICHRKAVFYSSSRPAVHNTLMFIKHNKNPRVTAFLASQLAAILRSDKDIPELCADNYVITFVPRGRRAVIEKGFDQSELLVRALSEKLGIPWAITLRRKRGGREQKKLNASQRVRNVKGLFEPVAALEETVGGKRIILVDDIVTTGASMAACISYLTRAGARETVCLSVASTENTKSNKKLSCN
ncbi:MAG: ComF family protein [Clostridia bacterium]|nr:ComF family protein [Clostridia bacterium]